MNNPKQSVVESSKNEVIPEKYIWQQHWVMSERDPIRPRWLNPDYVEHIEKRLAVANEVVQHLTASNEERLRRNRQLQEEIDRLRAELDRIAAIAADTSMAHEDRVYAIADVSRSSLAGSESPKRDTEAANTEVLRLRAAMRGLMPDGWDDGTMDHMPGIKAARLALAGVTDETQGTPCDSAQNDRVRPEDETDAAHD